MPIDNEPETEESARQADTVAGSTSEAIHRIEIVGWALFVVWAAGLVIWAVAVPDPYRQGWRLVIELSLLGGRAVNIADGTASGFGRLYLLFQCGLQDVVYTLIVYPWIIRIYRGATRAGRFGRIIESARKSAEKNSHFIEPLGGLGLWLFVFFPFWSTGVINGAALGFVLGMRTWVNLTIVLSSHLISVVALILFFETVSGFMDSTVEGSMQYLPWLVVGLLLTIWLVRRIVSRFRS